MTLPDRPELLLAQDEVTAIDFVFVHPDQVRLDVHFRRSPATLDTPLTGDLDPEQVSIESLSGADEVHVRDIAWVEAGEVLRITTFAPGGFSLYRLTLDDPRIDPYYMDVVFSFKAGCPSDLDCRDRPHECPPEEEEEVDFAVDYRARDFWSFRRALLDFAAQRYPEWQDNGRVADVGTMFAEILSALGDELAYYQDRVAREAYLETATQRRSLRRHARLVDYVVHDGLGAQTWVDVTASAAVTVPSGADLWALSEGEARVAYEFGRGLHDDVAGYDVDPARNSLPPHVWDEDDVCLPVGATELYLDGLQAGDLPLEAWTGTPPGRWLLLWTNPVDPAIRARVHAVRVVEIEETTDPVLAVPVTRLRWEEAQALPFELDLRTLEVRGNLLPATAGTRRTARFAIGGAPGVDAAVERTGPNATVAYLVTLPDPASEDLVWTGSDARAARPELRVFEEDPLGGPDREWAWRRSLVGTASSLPDDPHFTLDDGAWRRVVGWHRGGDDVVHLDYATGDGTSVRFGDGEFGRVPPRGTVFRVEYRVGGGRRGNVAAESLTGFDPAVAGVAAVTNPFAATGGLDPEQAADIRRLAPEAYRAVTFRAVRPEDYVEAAERLPRVQRAGAAFRWTGSWLTAFVTPDPRDTTVLAPELRVELEQQLDRFRQAGRQVHVLDPVYADLDLEITVCVEPTAFPGDVEERVLAALLGTRGFFSPGAFTFGTPLERSRLEAATQRVPGVRAVEGIRVRRRGLHGWRAFDELVLRAGADRVLRVENDPERPERGSLTIITEGGA